MAVDAEGILLDAGAANGAVDHEGIAVMGLADVFRHNLRARRQEAGMSITQLAERSGYDRVYITRVELGRRTNPTLAFIEAMTGSLECSAKDLLGV